MCRILDNLLSPGIKSLSKMAFLRSCIIKTWFQGGKTIALIITRKKIDVVFTCQANIFADDSVFIKDVFYDRFNFI